MKILDRTGLAIFSTIVLIISIVMCMIIFDWVSINTVTGIVSRTLNYGVGSKIVLGISIAFILLAIKCIFFSSSNKEKSEYKNGILNIKGVTYGPNDSQHQPKKSVSYRLKFIDGKIVKQ